MQIAILLVNAMVAAVLLAGRGVALGEGGGANRTLAAYRQKEDGLLVAAGFNPEEGANVWRRDGVYFGREAALQNAWREWHEHKGRNTSEEA
jgi:hypothetical protein